MTQKITTMLTMLVCFVSFAWSQQVALTPTTELTTGFYVIKTMSEKTNNGDAYVYGDTKNKQVRSTNKSDAFPALEGKTLTDDQATYIWEVTANTDGSIQIKNKNCGYYFGAFEQNGKDDKNISQSVAVDKAFDLTPLTSSKNNDWYILRSKEEQTLKYSGRWPWVTNHENHYVYMVANGNTQLGYWYYRNQTQDQIEENTPNLSKFQFYKVEYDVPVAVSVTYNYLMDGNVKKSVTIDCTTKSEFPDPTGLPAFVSAKKPAGNVTVENNNQTFDLTCTINLPFKTSDDSKKYYYYLNTDKGEESVMLHGNKSLAYRTFSQNENINEVINDLWYVKGNPFDGFKIYNASSNNDLRSTAVIIGDNDSWLAGKCELGYMTMDKQTTVWDLGSSENGNKNAFIIYPHEGNTWNCWRYNGTRIRFNYNADTGYTADFTLTPATISLPLNYSKADNANFATTCLPYAVEVANAEGTVKTYAGKLNAEQTGLEMNEVSAVPANQGIIIKGNTTDNEVEFRVIDAAETIDNDLQGTTEELTDLTGVYSFGRANGTGNVGFFRSTKSTLVANRAYIQLDNSASQSIAMNFDGNIVSSIESVNTNNTTMNNAPVFDLTGRRVMKMVKGNLYIQNGRKFIAQ